MTDPIKRRIQSAHDANGKRDERFVGLKHLAHIRKPSFILADQLNDMLAENNTKVRIRCQSFHPKLCVWICIFSIHHLPSGSKICPPTIIRKKNRPDPKTKVHAPPCQRPTTNQVKTDQSMSSFSFLFSYRISFSTSWIMFVSFLSSG